MNFSFKSKFLYVSIHLNKHPYSCCFNPHIYMRVFKYTIIHKQFPEHWKIWNIELDRKKKKQYDVIRFSRLYYRLCKYDIARILNIRNKLFQLTVYIHAHNNMKKCNFTIYYQLPFIKLKQKITKKYDVNWRKD